MMKKYIYKSILCISLCTGGALLAQSGDSIKSPSTLKERELQILNQQWGFTPNAAGMGMDVVNSGSLTTLGVKRSVGDYHRAQEGSAYNTLNFSTDRYDKFSDNLYMKGSFSFSLDKEFERSWSDVFNTYNSNPYIYGSSVKGNYETQKFALNFRLFTANKGKFNYGFELDYNVADMARQRDPRSRSYLLDYTLAPGITYSINKNNVVGINLSYRFEKEKMPGLSTIQTDPNLKYYDFKGLEHVVGTIGGYKGFERQFLSDKYGVAAQYNYKRDGLKWLTSVGFEWQWQETLGNKKQSPGSYNSYIYKLVSDLTIDKKSYIHNLKLTATMVDGGADEYIQEQESYRDPVTGITTETWVTKYTFKNRFVVRTYDAQASYDIYAKKASNNSYKWSAGVVASYNEFSNKFYLPSSDYNVSKLFGGVRGMVSLYSTKGRDLDVNFRAIGGYPVTTDLNLSRDNEYTNSVLRPDLEYHKLKTFDVGGDVRYTFPVKFGKSTFFGYAKIYAGNIFATDGFNWFSAGVSIGLLTL